MNTPRAMNTPSVKRQPERQIGSHWNGIVTLENRSQTHSKASGERHHVFQWIMTLLLPLPLTLGVAIPLEPENKVVQFEKQKPFPVLIFEQKLPIYMYGI